MPTTFKAQVVQTREELKDHVRLTSGKRNVPVLLPDGRTAVNEDGTPKIVVQELAHVYLQQDGCHPFFVEITSADAAKFKIGQDVTVTIG